MSLNGNDISLMKNRNEKLKHKLLKGGAWASGGKVVRSVSGLIINMLLARLLVPEQLGYYFISLSVATILALFARMGMGGALVRLIAEAVATQRTGDARAAIRYAYTFAALGIALTMILYLVIGWKWAGKIFHYKEIENIALLKRKN